MIGNRIYIISMCAMGFLCLALTAATVILWHRDSLDRQVNADNLKAITNAMRAQPATTPVVRTAPRSTETSYLKKCAGIYEIKSNGMLKYLDLRSDGTGISYRRTEYSSVKYGQENVKWFASASEVFVGQDEFKIEGYDLIDSKQNRWMRESFY